MRGIVYTSNTGHTAEYAKILSEKTGLPIYDLSVAGKSLQRGDEIIYLGWLFANTVKGYKKASKKFKIACVCAVGLCDTGTATEDVRRANRINTATPLFTMQGGIDKTKLRGVNKFMINMLTKALSSQKEKSADIERIIFLLTHDDNYVCEENTEAFTAWYNASK